MRLVLASVLLLLAGCSSCIDSLDPVSCCRQNARTSLQCEGSWIFEDGQCIFVCGESCPTDIMTCPDGTRLTRDPANCEFPECRNVCLAAADKDDCCDKENVGKDVPCPGAWSFSGDGCVYYCYKDMFEACSAEMPCKTGQCVILGADSFCAEDPCSLLDCKGECIVLESYPVQVKCSSLCLKESAECCSKAIQCKNPLAAVYNSAISVCECASVSCLDYCSEGEFVFFDVDSSRCVCRILPEEVRVGQPVDVSVGSSVRFRNVDAVISVLGVLEDSRCPREVQCVWPGRLSLLLSVEKNGTVSPVVLSTGSDVSFDGYDLMIYGVSASSLHWSDYTFSLLVRKS
ncbi:MAG: hypothetical protein ABIF10_00630 [Candidatus Woesearchaeota archaeon]